MIQLNCHRVYAAMSQIMCVNDVTVALLQEQYVSHGRVSGL